MHGHVGVFGTPRSWKERKKEREKTKEKRDRKGDLEKEDFYHRFLISLNVTAVSSLPYQNVLA